MLGFFSNHAIICLLSALNPRRTLRLLYRRAAQTRVTLWCDWLYEYAALPPHKAVMAPRNLDGLCFNSLKHSSLQISGPKSYEGASEEGKKSFQTQSLMKERKNLTEAAFCKKKNNTSCCDRAMVQMVPRGEKVKAGCGAGWRKTFKGCLKLPDGSAIYCVSCKAV